MARALLATVLLLLLSTFGPTATVEAYMKLRRSHGISQATSVVALQTFVGVRTLEVKGVVKGMIQSGGETLLMLGNGASGALEIKATEIPDWLIGNEVPARLLIRATRLSEQGRISAELLSAGPEDQVAALEPKPKVVVKPPPIAIAPPKKSVPGRTWELPVSDAAPHYAAFIKKRNPRLSDQQAWTIAQGVLGFSIQYGVDARLIMAMVMIESGFNPNATSRAGAQGLGQLMPGTARGMGVSNSYDSLENLSATVRLVRGHLEKYTASKGDRFEGLVLTLAAYNAGSGAVRRHGGVPPYRETQNYVRKVVSLYEKFSRG